jgi:hypothetical protein
MTTLSSLTRRSLWVHLLVTTSLGWFAGPLAAESSAESGYDVVVYGGTSAGVVAAVQTRQMGKSVVLIEPSHRLGGLSSGGLGQTDIGNKAAIGGLARQFYQAVREHYRSPAAWKWQRREEYMDSGQTRTAAGEDTRWTFEPSAALKIFETWVKDHNIEVVYGERLDRRTGVADALIPADSRFDGIGTHVSRRMFIDATYEGDLMAAASELRDRAGKFCPRRDAQPGCSPPGQIPSVCPRAIPTWEGRSREWSAAVPGPDGPGVEASTGRCGGFRMCLTDHPDNRIPFRKPDGYDPSWYELLLRNFEAGESGMPWINSAMPNRKTDTNNRTGFSTDFIGQNYEYPEGTYDQRARIVACHLLYQQGLMWTLANHPRVPEHIRREVARWVMCKDEFT